MTEARDVYDVLAEVWDTRELIELIERLETERDDLDLRIYDDDFDYEDRKRLDDLNEQLTVARDLEALVEPLAVDYRYGETVIRDDHFEQYARELADDIGAVKDDAGWPTSYIDWPAAADALKVDYSSFEFDGCEWWVR